MGDQALLPSYSSIAGAWVLDLSRSDTMGAYLRCLQTPNVAIQAQMAGEQACPSRNVIALDDSLLIIHKSTAVNNFTETYGLNVEQVRQTSSGVRRSTASLGVGGLPNRAIIVTTMLRPGGTSLIVVEARNLMEGGLVHQQEINVSNMATGGECFTVRTWVRVPVTQEDIARLLAE